MTCPNTDQLLQFINRSLAADAAESCQRHVEACAACQRQLSRLLANNSDRHQAKVGEHPARNTATDRIDEGHLRLPTIRIGDPPRNESLAAADHQLPKIPRYDIVEVIGYGGMGVVYKARQRDLDRWVALKMMQAYARPHSNDLVRFHREALAIARVQHPNIIQIYDVGEWQAPNGSYLPYLCMEYAAGGSLAELLQHRPHSPQWAAEITLTLARAVAEAHRHGIVHRDLKPGNVLLTGDKTEIENAVRETMPLVPGARYHSTLKMRPVAAAISERLRISDFGLAMFLDDAQTLTQSGEVVGTPAYMAPEQAAGQRMQIGPPTDVYALGVILYEMITGRLPFLGATPLETMLQVLHHEPAPPRRLMPTIPCDLETICLKCLEKDPARRYQTAGELADELERFLLGEPIRARPVSWVVRSLKWARRNPVAATLSAVLILVVLGSLVTLAILYTRAEDARHRQFELAVVAQQQRDAAQRALEELERANIGSQAIAEFFFQDLLGAVRPDRSGGRASVTFLEALEQAEKRLSERFQGRSYFEGAVRNALANAYAALDLHDKALEHFQRDLELRGKGASATERRLRARILANIGSCYVHLKQPSAARAAFSEAWQICHQLAGPDDLETLRQRKHLANLTLQLGQPREAEAEFRDIIDRLEQQVGPQHELVLQARLELAGVLSARWRFVEAEQQARQVLETCERTLSPTHSDCLEARHQIGQVLMSQRKYDEAVTCFEQLLRLERQALGDHHPRVKSSRFKLAIAQTDAGQWQPAEETLRDLLQHSLAQNPVPVMEVASYQSALGALLTATGRAAEAEPLLRAALKTREKVLGPRHPLTAVCRSHWGQCLAKLRRFEEAEEAFLAAWQALSAAPSAVANRVAELKERLIQLYEDWGRPDQVERWRAQPLPEPP